MLFGGRTESATGKDDDGSLVIEARDLAHADAIARSDPAVSEGLMRLKPHRFMVVADAAGAASQSATPPS